MKKSTGVLQRKHGFRARALGGEDRLKTSLTFETNSQVYLWVTDRGRSRLVKH